jgi:hypothetical protein
MRRCHEQGASRCNSGASSRSRPRLASLASRELTRLEGGSAATVRTQSECRPSGSGVELRPRAVRVSGGSVWCRASHGSGGPRSLRCCASPQHSTAPVVRRRVRYSHVAPDHGDAPHPPSGRDVQPMADIVSRLTLQDRSRRNALCAAELLKQEREAAAEALLAAAEAHSRSVANSPERGPVR